MSERIKIPVIILSGFLGSGKTTLLNRLLHFAFERGLQPAVLMNELGKLDVDGAWLRSQFGSLTIEKLIDGCICCSKKSEIPLAVQTLLGQRPDVLFVELTGVANPEEIADALADPALVEKLSIRHIITVIDAEHVLEYNSFFHSDKALIRTLRRQIEVADLLLVNKVSLVSASTSAKIAKLLQKHNPAARVLYADHCQIDLERLFSQITPIPAELHPANPADSANQATSKRSPFHILRGVPQTVLADTDSNDASKTDGAGTFNLNVNVNVNLSVDPSFTRLATVSFRIPSDRVPNKDSLEQWLRRQATAKGEQLLRAKGFMNSAVMHYAGHHIVWQPSTYSGEPYLVIIGLDLDAERLTREWLNLIQG